MTTFSHRIVLCKRADNATNVHAIYGPSQSRTLCIPGSLPRTLFRLESILPFSRLRRHWRVTAFEEASEYDSEPGCKTTVVGLWQKIGPTNRS